MTAYDKLLQQNRAWAKKQVDDDPLFFSRLSKLQRPEFLWIGCSDSRVPANQITGTLPGEMFVHRNIANLVVSTDTNLLSVLEFAVEHLEVQHIIVCGHYGCGGVNAAMRNQSYGVLDTWLRHIKDVYRLNDGLLAKQPTDDARSRLLVELVVGTQVRNLAKTTVVQRAWKRHRRPHLHGWVYGLENGLLKPVTDLPPGAALERIYEFDGL